MNTEEYLQALIPAIKVKLSEQFAKDEQIREVFIDQLEHFFDLLRRSIREQNPEVLDSILDDWVKSRTTSDLESSNSLAPLFDSLFEVTLASAIDDNDDDNNDAMATLTWIQSLYPYLKYASRYVSKCEVDSYIQFIRDDLDKARIALATLERSKSDFISVAAHELKTPLTLIDGYSAMLQEEFPSYDDPQLIATLMEGINNGTRRLQSIINDMIDVSLIDNDMMTITHQPVWVNKVLARAHEQFAATALARQIRISIGVLPNDQAVLHGDPLRLQQVFFNLLSNAIKFTPDGGEVSINHRLLPGFIEIVVSDTGIGIDPEDHDKIFDKFSAIGSPSLHSSGKTKFKGGGPGLGLPIAKGIVEAHGGTIWVESQKYDEESCPGSAFHVLLPLKYEPIEERLAKILSPYDIDPIGD